MKDLESKLRKIKHHCEQHKVCDNCIYNIKNSMNIDACKIGGLFFQFKNKPKYWNTEYITKVLNGDV